MAAVDERYITIDSKAFKDRYPNNNGFAFTNLILPPLDNSNYDLELRVIDVALVGIESPIPLALSVECDLINPYQCGDGMTQSVFTFLAKRKYTRESRLVCDMYSAPNNNTYYPIRETHGPFDLFKSISIKLVKSFGEWSEDEAMELKRVHPSNVMAVDIQRVMVRLHIRKSQQQKLNSKEATRLIVV